MVQPQSALLVVVADGEHARFLVPTQQRSLQTVASFTSEAVHQHSADLGAERPGASFHSQSSAHHAIAPRHDLHVMAKEKFARTTAKQVEGMVGRESIDEIILIAPAPILGVIMASLPEATARRVIASPHKDLVKTPDHRLWAHVAQWIRPAHLPPAELPPAAQSPRSESPG